MTPVDRGTFRYPEMPNYLESSYVSSEPMTPEEALNDVFGPDHIIWQVARCESNMRQFDASGEVLRGIVNPHDVGLLQINEDIWLQESQKLNIDIYTAHGNALMARHILKVQGLGAWKASQPCWAP